MKLLIAVLAAAASFGTSAMADAPLAGDDCVLIKDIRNHTVVDQNTMLMEVYGKGVYRVTTAQACFRSAVSADSIAFNTRGREKVCKASQLGLTARSGYCGAQSMVRLTPEEVAALPRKLKP
jgi:hypothetical protein